ncbi:MAG: hypothetical protein JO235_25660 [Chroococcidiopsidaceae cyanobacterium CP_BM_RX_35]|nr:hypothetical protein [Chroococcidiopsidaceae cyanobacterium CP_BM_RX_35]
MGHKRRAVGRFSNRLDAEYAFIQLNRAGFSEAQISIIAKYADCEAQTDGIDPSEWTEAEVQKEATGAIAGGMLGAVVGCLVGLGMLPVPGIGVLLAIKTSGTALATTLAGGGIGVTSGGLLSTFAGATIFSGRAKRDGSRYLPGEYLVMVDVMTHEVAHAESILNRACSSKVWVC